MFGGPAGFEPTTFTQIQREAPARIGSVSVVLLWLEPKTYDEFKEVTP
jgi:hypothetical protein